MKRVFEDFFSSDLVCNRQPFLKPLFLALKEGADLDSVKRFLDDIDDINVIYGFSGRNVLHYAIGQNCELEIIEELIYRGLSINGRDNVSMTPLHLAVASNKSEEYVPKLLALGADVNAQNQLGDTPLILAVGTFKSVEVIKLLLEYGADTECVYDTFNGAFGCSNIVELAIVSGGVSCAKVLAKTIILKYYDKNVSILNELKENRKVISRPEISKFIDQCFGELSLMKTTKINSTYSVMNFALFGKNCCSKPLYDNVLLTESQLSTMFPIYSDVINHNIALGFQRGQRINHLHDLQACIISKGYDSKGREKVVILNFDCIEKICSYLTNLELEIFSQAFHV